MRYTNLQLPHIFWGPGLDVSGAGDLLPSAGGNFGFFQQVTSYAALADRQRLSHPWSSRARITLQSANIDAFDAVTLATARRSRVRRECHPGSSIDLCRSLTVDGLHVKRSGKLTPEQQTLEMASSQDWPMHAWELRPYSLGKSKNHRPWLVGSPADSTFTESLPACWSMDTWAQLADGNLRHLARASD